LGRDHFGEEIVNFINYSYLIIFSFKISGGTGITPFYQLLRAVFSGNSSFRGRITLLHSSRTPSELPPRDILDPLIKFAQHNPEKFRLKFFVDSFGESKGQSFTELEVHKGRISKDSICGVLNSASRIPWWRNLFSQDSDISDRKILFLVCGPEQLVPNYILCSGVTH
jgi:cytochrome-b5 reductase